MNIINKYNIVFPSRQEDILNKIKEVQKELVLQKGSAQNESVIEELSIIERLNDILEYTPDSRVERIVRLYDFLVQRNALTDELHHIFLDYMKGDFAVLNKINDLCEKKNRDALLAKAFYLYNGTFDVIKRQQSRKCLHTLYLIGEEEVYSYLYEGNYGKNYVFIKKQTIFSAIMLCFTMFAMAIIIIMLNPW